MKTKRLAAMALLTLGVYLVELLHRDAAKK